jgi:hypothetical protein
VACGHLLRVVPRVSGHGVSRVHVLWMVVAMVMPRVYAAMVAAGMDAAIHALMCYCLLLSGW